MNCLLSVNMGAWIIFYGSPHLLCSNLKDKTSKRGLLSCGLSKMEQWKPRRSPPWQVSNKMSALCKASTKLTCQNPAGNRGSQWVSVAPSLMDHMEYSEFIISLSRGILGFPIPAPLQFHWCAAIEADMEFVFNSTWLLIFICH